MAPKTGRSAQGAPNGDGKETQAMIRAFWLHSSTAALLCTGLPFRQNPNQHAPTYSKGDTISLQGPDKGETKVKVIKVTPGADGKMTYEVEDVKTGDKATI